MKEVVLILYPILIFIFTFLFQIFFIIIKERRLRNKLCQKDNQKLYKSKKIIIKILIAFVISFVLEQRLLLSLCLVLPFYTD